MAKYIFIMFSFSLLVALNGCDKKSETQNDAGSAADADTDTDSDSDSDTDTDTDVDTDVDSDTDTDTDVDTDTDTDSDGDDVDPLWIPDAGTLPSAAAGEWTWVPVDEASCRDGSTAGLSVRYNDASDNLLIYLEGMGLCYSKLTCDNNASAISEMRRKPVSEAGIFDFANDSNPFKDWNVVYIPYCTGDCHMGSNPGGNVPDVGSQKFVGGDNYRYFLGKIRATFPDTEQVFLIGYSGGAIGAGGNAYITSLAFGDNVKFGGISDGATVMRDEYITPCLQKQLSDMWNTEAYIPKDCTDCFPSKGGSLSKIFEYVSNKVPNNSAGLISSTTDSTVRIFFAFGLNDCAGGDVYPVELYQAGLEDLRTYTGEIGMKGGTYYYVDDLHGRLTYNDFYTTSVGGMTMLDWVNAVIAGGTVNHVGP